MAANVQFEIAKRVDHRLVVAHLAGDVEDRVGARNGLGDFRVADVGDEHLDVVGDVRSVTTEPRLE